MSKAKFAAYLAQALDELDAKQAKLQDEFGLGKYARQWLDLEQAKLELFDDPDLDDDEGDPDDDVPAVRASVLPVGTFSWGEGTAAGTDQVKTFRWAWANESLPTEVRHQAARLREKLAWTGMPLFQAEAFECKDEMAWELAALACKALDGVGVYPMNRGSLRLFLVLTKVERG